MTERVRLPRRRFLGQGAFLGGGLLAEALAGERGGSALQNAILRSRRSDAAYELNDPAAALYTVCMNCNTGCGIKAKIQDGLVAKLDGNPYSPWTLVPHLPMSASLDDAARVDAGLCPKGQAAVQTAYDPYRLRTVLKRAGRRGENRWLTISFEHAVTELVEGGALFAHVPGEERRHVEGLRSLMALRDGRVAKPMAEDVKAIWDRGLTIERFRSRHRTHLEVLIDPDHPDLGPRNNQFVIAWGRLKGGRSDFIRRFGAGFGTVNLHGHTTVCQGSLYFTCKAISEQYEAGKFSGGKKFYWQADTENARYILFVGANLFEANYGPTNRTVRLTDNLQTGRTRIAVADPRFSKLASKAHRWLPVRPGGDTPLAMAMIRWIIENRRFDAAFLRGANRAAARANGETSWTNATWLVEVRDGRPGRFVRAADLGLARPQRRRVPDPKDRTKTISYEEKFFVAMWDGQPVPLDPNDDRTAVNGDLFVDTALRPRGGGAPVRVKSALQLLKEGAEERPFEEWCEMAGVAAEDVAIVARELTSYGKQAVVEPHRGPAQHTDGFYSILAWMTINMLLGNFDWKGGLVAASTYSYDGARGGPFDLTRVAGKIDGFGISLIRHEVAYEKTTLFAGYPARRNWYPLASDVYQEIVPSIGDAYPYPVKALFLYMGTPVYALPAGQSNIEVLADVARLPLFFTSDVTVGTTSIYADYVFPDLTWLERWEFHGSHPSMPNQVAPVRQPVIGPIPETVTVYGQEMPISLEALLLALAERLGLRAFGPNALGEGMDLRRPEDYYLRAVANIAVGEKPGLAVPDADARELELFHRARRHLPRTAFDADRWRAVVGAAIWPKVVYVLNRGGRFEEHARGYAGDRLAHRYGALLNLYQEKTASMKYAGIGRPYPGLACYVPQQDFAGNTLEELGAGYDLHMITHRVITQTKSRTIGNYWLLAIAPENGIVINAADARRLGLRHGERVRVVSATNPEGVWSLGHGVRKPMVGAVIVTETIRPGVVSFALGFGHWATGAADIEVDGEVIPGDRRRAAGIHANAAMWTDPALRHTTCLVDPVGGSVSFYDTKVRLVRV